MTSVPTKVSFGQEIRRLACNGVYADLVASIGAIYNVPANQLVLQYTDDEGDLVHVSSQPELDEAVKLSLNATPKLLRITASVKTLQPYCNPMQASMLTTSAIQSSSAPLQQSFIQPAACESLPDTVVDQSDIYDLKRQIRELKEQKRQLKFMKRSPDCNKQSWESQRDNLASKIRHLKSERKHTRGWCKGNRRPLPNQIKYRARFINATPEHPTMAPGEQFTLVFKVRNEGDEDWPVGTLLVPIGMMADHPHLGSAGKYFPVPPVAPGNTVEIQVPLQAPQQSGRYYGAWKLATSTMQKFGPRLDIDVTVEPQSDDESPKVPKAQPSNINWLSLLDQLESMGYSDKKANLHLLQKYNGNLSLVVDHLLAHSPK